jgi:hypothetical protein
MTYKGVVKGNVVVLEEHVTLPEGTHVRVIPERPGAFNTTPFAMTLKEWLWEARQVRAQLPSTGDSVEILRQLREERTNR